MTQLEILYRYEGEPSEPAVFALGSAREVYGIRRMDFDREAKTLRVEYDATRLNAAVVTGLVRRSGLHIVEELPLVPPPPPLEEAVAPAAKA